MNKRDAGVTLIELMIVVAIVGILAAVAYPSYLQYVQASRRAEAQADLLELAQWMERRFTVNARYGEADPKTAVTLPFSSSPRSGEVHYHIVVAADDSSFTLTATPRGGQIADDCGTLALSHTGSKSATKGTAAVTGCW